MKIFVSIFLFCVTAKAAVIDYAVPQDSLGHYEFDLYDSNGLQRGSSTNPIYTGRTWSLLSSTDSIGAVQQGNWSLVNITGTVSLPTGAATAALQTTGNTTLATISGQLPAQSSYSAKVVQSNTSIAVKSGAGVLHAIVIGANNTGGTLYAYDGTSAAGTAILGIQAGTPTGGLLSVTGNQSSVSLGPIDIKYSTGLFIVTSGSTSNYFTVVYY